MSGSTFAVYGCHKYFITYAVFDIVPLWPILFLLWDYHYMYVSYVYIWHTSVECMNLCIWIVWSSYLNFCFLIMGRNLSLFLWAAGENWLISALQVCKIWSSVIRMMSVQWIERTWKLLWPTLIYCLRICWEGLKKSAVGLVGYQDCDSARTEHEEILTLDCGVWYKSCNGIFLELGGGVRGWEQYRTLWNMEVWSV